MNTRPRPLTEQAECPWCGTKVPAKACVCTGCDAIYCVHDMWWRTAKRCFWLGLFIAWYASAEHVLLFAIASAVAGGLFRWGSDEGSPFWLRTQP